MKPKLRPETLAKIATGLFLAGLLVRAITLPWPGTVDVKAWKAWSTRAAEIGFARVYGPPDAELTRLARERGGPLALLTMPYPRTLHFYRGEEYYVDYPPGSLLLLTAVAKAHARLDPTGSNGRLFNALLNLLPLLASLGIAWTLWRSAPPPLGAWRALAFWCNPAVLLAAALGYQDVVMGAAALLCVMALTRRRMVLATVFLVVAGLLKPQAILLIPTVLVVLVREHRPGTWLKAVAAGLAVTVAVLSPWMVSGYFLSALEGALRPGGEITVSSQALNLWWVIGYLVQWIRESALPLARILFLDEFRTLAGWDALLPARILLGSASLACVLLLLKHSAQDSARIPISIITQTYVFFLFSTGMHENHAFLALILAPLLIGAGDKAGRLIGWSSGLLLANLFLFEGFGRGILRDRSFVRLRLLAGVDLTVWIAVGQMVVLGLFFRFWVRRVRSENAAGPAK